MLMEVERKRVRKYFLWEQYIREGIIEEQQRLAASKHCKNSLGYDDPTGGIVARKNSYLRFCKFTLPNGKRIKLNWPEKWIEVIEQVYAMYGVQPIVGMVQERIRDRKSPDVIADFAGIGRNTYYRWEREFLEDAVLLAAKRGLLD